MALYVNILSKLIDSSLSWEYGDSPYIVTVAKHRYRSNRLHRVRYQKLINVGDIFVLLCRVCVNLVPPQIIISYDILSYIIVLVSIATNIQYIV